MFIQLKRILLVFSALLVLSVGLYCPVHAGEHKKVSNKILSLNITRDQISNEVVIINLKRDFSGYAGRIFYKPYRLVIDIFSKTYPFKTLYMKFKKGLLRDLRAGYHPDKIRVVMVLRGFPEIRYGIERDGKEIKVLFSNKGVISDFKARESGPFKLNKNKRGSSEGNFKKEQKKDLKKGKKSKP